MTHNRVLPAIGAIIGVVVGLGLILFAASRPNGRRNADLVPGRLIPEAGGPLGEVVMHYVPQLEALVEPTYTDFLRAIPADVRIRFVLPRAMSNAQKAQLEAFLGRIDPTGDWARRVVRVEVDGPITTWSKDRALVAQSPGAPPNVLLAPAEPERRWAERHNDWQTVRAIAAAAPERFGATVLPLDFDAGDFVVDDGRIIVDTNLLEKNAHRGIATVADLRRRLTTLFRTPVLVLGREPGDTPRHHLAMYMTPLTDGVVLVGDPAAARAIVGDPFDPGDPSGDTGEPLHADFSEEMIARFERAASELSEAGYRVERIPNVPFDDKTYISYTNAVFETRGADRVAYMPVYGIAALDAAARQVYERVGWRVRPIRVRDVYPFHGTIGCLVNVVSRGDSADNQR